MQDEAIRKILEELRSTKVHIQIAFPVIITSFFMVSLFLVFIVWDTRKEIERLEDQHNAEFRAFLETYSDDKRFRGSQITNLKAHRDSTKERLERLEKEQER